MSFLRMKGHSQPPHEELVVDILGQEFVEGSYIQHDAGFAKSYESMFTMSAPHTQLNSHGYPVYITNGSRAADMLAQGVE